MACCLSELCANLLDNAIRYTPQGGIVTVSLHRDGEAVLLDVEDSGPGIDDAQIQQALMPFHRLENVGDNPGAGLGTGAGQRYCAPAPQPSAAAA